MIKILLDTNLLVLWLVGSVDESRIQSHKATKIFSKSDFYNLQELLGQSGTSIVVTPHVLTETSNLLAERRDKNRVNIEPDLFGFYAEFLNSMNLDSPLNAPIENFIEARKIGQSAYFSQIGLTDAGLLDSCFKDHYLLTNDDNLCRTAKRLGHQTIQLQLGKHK